MQGGHEGAACLLRDLGAREQLLELVDEQRAAHRRRRIARPHRGRDVPEGLRDGEGQRGRLASSERHQLLFGALREQLRERLRSRQRAGQPAEHVARALRGREVAGAPAVHFLHDARRREERQDARADERGLTDAAHAQHHGEGMALRGPLLQQAQDLAHGAGAAEEDVRVLALEGLEAAEWRALPALLPVRLLLTVVADALEERLAQVRLDHGLEVARVLEGEERARHRLPVGEVPVEELVEQPLLVEARLDLVGITQLHHRRRGLAVDEDAGRAAVEVGLHGVLELVLRPRQVPTAVLARDVRGEHGAEAGPEDEDREVGVAGSERLIDLGLEVARRVEGVRLPEEGVDLDLRAEFAGEPLEGAAHDLALLADVARRGDEDLH